MTYNNPIVLYYLGISKNKYEGKSFIKIDNVILAQ